MKMSIPLVLGLLATAAWAQPAPAPAAPAAPATKAAPSAPAARPAPGPLRLYGVSTDLSCADFRAGLKAAGLVETKTWANDAVVLFDLSPNLKRVTATPVPLLSARTVKVLCPTGQPKPVQVEVVLDTTKEQKSGAIEAMAAMYGPHAEVPLWSFPNKWSATVQARPDGKVIALYQRAVPPPPRTAAQGRATPAMVPASVPASAK